jgi:hypothetical protein
MVQSIQGTGKPSRVEVMAMMRLSRRQAKEGTLPALCIRCGKPAASFLDKRLSWYPLWMEVVLVLSFACPCPFVLVGIMVAFLLSRRARVRLPVCAAHKNHWRWRSVLTWGSLIVLCCTLVLLILLHPANYYGSPLIFGLGIALLLWGTVAYGLKFIATRACTITKRDLILSGVSMLFIERFLDELRDDEVEWDAVDSEHEDYLDPEDRLRPSSSDD